MLSDGAADPQQAAQRFYAECIAPGDAYARKGGEHH